MTDLPQEKKPKRNLTDKQKAARSDNLAKGRQKRMEMIKQKRESKQQEYDLSSDESYDSDCDTSSSDNDAFVISKAKKKPIKQRVQKESKPNLKRQGSESHLRKDVDELKSMMIELASMQKKQQKKERREPRRSGGGTKIVVLPQQGGGNGQLQSQSQPKDDYLEKLRKSIFD